MRVTNEDNVVPVRIAMPHLPDGCNRDHQDIPLNCVGISDRSVEAMTRAVCSLVHAMASNQKNWFVNYLTLFFTFGDRGGRAAPLLVLLHDSVKPLSDCLLSVSL